MSIQVRGVSSFNTITKGVRTLLKQLDGSAADVKAAERKLQHDFKTGGGNLEGDILRLKADASHLHKGKERSKAYSMANTAQEFLTLSGDVSRQEKALKNLPAF